MSRSFACLTAAFILVIGSFGGAAKADWPAKVFAPYCSVNSIMNAYNATGQKYFTLAFCNARNGEPNFGGTMAQHNGLDQIEALRAKGGDVIMSFGGAGANEIAWAEPDVVKVAADYQSVVDTYKLTWIDMDIEDKAMYTPGVMQRRNAALALVQRHTPGLRVVYTLSADPNTDFPDSHTDGVCKAGLDILRDAKEQGLKIDICNVMTMDYGGRVDDMMKAGNTMGYMAEYSATVAHTQIMNIDPNMKIGITPDLGVNDDATEVFKVEDAQTVMDFAKHNDWITLLTFWNISSDGGGRGRGGFGGAATRAGATRRGGRAGAATRAGGFAGGGGGARRNSTRPTYNAGPWAFTNTFKTFTVGFTPINEP